MARFMDVQSGFVGVTDSQVREAHTWDRAIEETESAHVKRARRGPESGTVFCLSTGPSKEAVQQPHHEAGHPADALREKEYRHLTGRRPPKTDLVVGADGLREIARQSLWPDAPVPRCAGYAAWRPVKPVRQPGRYGSSGQCLVSVLVSFTPVRRRSPASACSRSRRPRTVVNAGERRAAGGFEPAGLICWSQF